MEDSMRILIVLFLLVAGCEAPADARERDNLLQAADSGEIILVLNEDGQLVEECLGGCEDLPDILENENRCVRILYTNGSTMREIYSCEDK